MDLSEMLTLEKKLHKIHESNYFSKEEINFLLNLIKEPIHKANVLKVCKEEGITKEQLREMYRL